MTRGGEDGGSHQFVPIEQAERISLSIMQGRNEMMTSAFVVRLVPLLLYKRIKIFRKEKRGIQGMFWCR